MVDLVKLAQEKSGMNPAANTEIEKANIAQAQKDPTPKPAYTPPAPKVVETEWYFQAERPGFGFMYRLTHRQVKFEHLFFKTQDKKLAHYIRMSYGNQVTELSKEQYEDAVMLKPGAPEPVRSSIVVTKLPG
jgi:hypothetical protein